MIMTLEVDVTAERRHYNTHRPQGDTANLGAKGPVKLTNPWAEGPSILRTFPFTTLLHNPRRQPRPFFLNCGEAATTTLGLKGRQTYEPSGRRPVHLKNPRAEGASRVPCAILSCLLYN